MASLPEPHETRPLLPLRRTTAMHSKRHRRERQRRAAFRFVCRNGRRKQPIYWLNHWTPRRAWHWWIELRIILAAAAQRQAQKITLTNQPKK